MEIRRCKFVPGADVENGKRRKLDVYLRDHDNNTASHEKQKEMRIALDVFPKFGVASLCGRRRDMEDAVAVHPSFTTTKFDFYGVYDGHGCSHVATMCKNRLHEMVNEELVKDEGRTEWKSLMEKCFNRMDKEVIAWTKSGVGAQCSCELRLPERDAAGSTAVIAIVTPEKIIVANVGDSRAVMCSRGRVIPLTADQKPDRPDEYNRIRAAGGRVIFWEGARVSGLLAMSRAIGDIYLKPYVISEPEVTMRNRDDMDDFLILASDGFWDVVKNETACTVARMCLRGKPSQARGTEVAGDRSDDACSDAAMVLTKLALARNSTDNVSIVVVDLKRDIWA